jgi:hypothetical protein
VSGSTTLGPVLYTVPSGRYAKVFVQSFFRVDSALPQNRTLSVGSSSVNTSGTGVLNWISSFEQNSILAEGQTIAIINTGINVTYSFVIREFSSP